MASSNISMLGRTGNCADSDECYTPKEAVIPLLPYLPTKNTYYDCTSGVSMSIVSTLRSNGRKCIASGGRDFMLDSGSRYDVIVTNPPYSNKDAFISRCYELGVPFAMLLPVTALQGVRRCSMFAANGIELLVLDRRIDFTGRGSPHFGVAWFCHNLLPSKLCFAEVAR